VGSKGEVIIHPADLCIHDPLAGNFVGGVPSCVGTEDKFVRQLPGMIVMAKFLDDLCELDQLPT